jgi:hypothetical protein
VSEKFLELPGEIPQNPIGQAVQMKFEQIENLPDLYRVERPNRLFEVGVFLESELSQIQKAQFRKIPLFYDLETIFGEFAERLLQNSFANGFQF